MGLAAMYLVSDELEDSLPIPKGNYDLPVVISDKMFAANGSLTYDDEGHSGLYGDVMLVNGRPWPNLQVEPRKYRFRILNASLSRGLRLQLSNTAVPMTVIATDGGLMPRPQNTTQLRVGMAERYEVVIRVRSTVGVRPRSGPLRADARGDHEPDPRHRGEAGHLVQHHEADDQRDRRFEAHQRPERRRGEPAQGQQLEAERDDGQQQGEPEPDEHELGGEVPDHRRAHRERGDQRGHRHRDGQTAQARDLVPDPLRQHDVGRPTGRGRQGVRHTDGVGAAVPRLGQQDDPHGGQRRPLQLPSAAADHGDAQRTEELQRARRAQGQPRDRGHEEQCQPSRHDPERDARAQRAAGERGRTRAHEHQQEDAGPRETQPRRPLRPDAVEKADRRGQSELDAHHRTDGEGRAGAGGGNGHRSIGQNADRLRPRENRGQSVQ